MFDMSFGKSLKLILALGLVLAIGCGDDGTTNPMTDAGFDAGGGEMDGGPETDGGPEMDAGPETDAGPMENPCAAPLAAAVDAADLAGFSSADATEMVRADGNQALEADYAGHYRDDLANHPGCVARESYDANSEAYITDNEATVPAGTPYTGSEEFPYDCAAKEYTQDSPDTAKPIVILVHGNSSGVVSFEEYFVGSRAGTTISNVAGFEFAVDAAVRTQLASTLLADGYEVISFDARTDLVATLEDYNADSATGNPFGNIDHGWAVPMLQHLVKTVMQNNPDRQVSLVGHSLGVTVIRDALRRLWNERAEEGGLNPFAQVKDVVLLSGANHGVANATALCAGFEHMRGTVACEMGDRDSFVPTYFTMPLNGPDDVWAVPCADGSYAYGETDACGGNAVEYTTVTMRDIADGMLQDEFVSEASSSISAPTECVENELVELTDFDSSSFFLTILPGFFANHFGSARSDAGIALIAGKLAD